MDRERARALYDYFGAAVAYVEVEDDAGIGLGSAFHVGQGLFVTARHVVQNKRILRVGTTVPSVVRFRSAFGAELVDERYGAAEAEHVEPPRFPENENVDLALLVTTGLDAPTVPLTPKPDDVGRDVILESVIVLGYPRVPLADDPPTLVVVTAEVNAAVRLYLDQQLVLVLSSTARGGFSGGLVLSQGGTALGVLRESLVTDAAPTELGFLGATQIQAVHVLLEEIGFPVSSLQGEAP